MHSPKRKSLRKSIAELQSTYENRHGKGKFEYGGKIRARLKCDGPSPKTCQWLYGEPKERDFCKLQAKAESSYCEGHHNICYVTKPLTDDALSPASVE